MSETNNPLLMTQSAFARKAGVGPDVIHRHMLKRLKKAVINNQIDAAHPDAVAYLAEKADPYPEATPKKNTRVKERLAEDTAFRVPDELDAFADMTLREIIAVYGTDTRFVTWLDAVKKIEDIETKRLTNAKTKKELVSLQLITDHVIGTYDAAHLDLLQNGTTKLAFTIDGMSKSGSNLALMEESAAEIIGGVLSTYKEKLARFLRELTK